MDNPKATKKKRRMTIRNMAADKKACTQALQGFTDLMLNIALSGADPSDINTLEAKRLIECSDVDATGGWNDSTALMIAAQHKKHIELVHALLNKGANVNMHNKLKNTALHIAAEHGNLECVKVLISRKSVNLKATNNYQQTALMLAIEAYSEKRELCFDIVKQLADNDDGQLIMRNM